MCLIIHYLLFYDTMCWSVQLQGKFPMVACPLFTEPKKQNEEDYTIGSV